MSRLAAAGVGVLLAWWVATASGAPAFDGLLEARAAPGAVALRWERAGGDDRRGAVTYRVYTNDGRGWTFDRPAAEVRGTDHVVAGLAPGRPVAFLVRARDRSGEDTNRRVLRATPTRTLPAEEFRAVWINRFEWTGSSRERVASGISSMMRTLGQGHFNAVLFQVRGQGDTLYPSPEEPWSPLMKGDTREFDAVAHAVREAHRNDVEFHAWMNLSVIWQSGAKSPPADPRHPFHRFANATRPETRQGLIHDASGRPVQWGADGYVWLTHGNPEVNAYLRRQVRHFLARYQVDGLHLDDRTGNPNGVSRDPLSVARFRGRGNPDGTADFGAWQRDQLTRFLRRVYVECKIHDPGLLVSAAPFGIADKDRLPGYGGFSDGAKFGVEPEAWLRAGVLDVLVPQIYWDLPDPEPNFATLVRDWMRHNRSGRPIWPGSALGRYGGEQPLVPVQLRHVALARAYGAGGNAFYNYSGAKPTEWISAGRLLYPARARVPVPAHMRQGRAGHIGGTVVDGSGRPVVDAWIRIQGDPVTYLTCGDGFFAVPGKAPGVYTLEVRSVTSRTVVRVPVRPDSVARPRIVLD